MDLIADHISHRFGELAVLDDVSFTVGAGEVVAIVGPSGCGKSTLLSILGGLLRPHSGAVETGSNAASTVSPFSAAAAFDSDCSGTIFTSDSLKPYLSASSPSE